jgi:uncharacterized membrane protein YhaH (DUF805 family)
MVLNEPVEQLGTFAKLFGGEGRKNGRQFLTVSVFLILLQGLNGFAISVLTPIFGNLVLIVSILIGLALIWANVCNILYRLTDLQKAAGWMFLILVPVLNVFFFFYLVLWRGKATTYPSRSADLREYSSNSSGRVIPPLTRKSIEKNDT